MTRIKKIVMSIVLSSAFCSLALAPVAVSAQADVDFGNTNALFKGFNRPANTATDPREIIRRLINIVMGFLGLIAVVIILISGFQWMTAGGNDENVTKARNRLIQGVIGLALILASWTVAYFIIQSLGGAVTTSGAQ